jgi:hypothetical protein
VTQRYERPFSKSEKCICSKMLLLPARDNSYLQFRIVSFDQQSRLVI